MTIPFSTPELTIDPSECHALMNGDHADPHRVLGAHPLKEHDGGGAVIRAFLPDACSAECICQDDDPAIMQEIAEGGFFGLVLPGQQLPFTYRLKYQTADGQTVTRVDPYRFLPTISQEDLYYMGEGTHLKLWNVLGAHAKVVDGISGVAFAVWAPNARRVSVVGDFCQWDGRKYPMRSLGASGVFEIFIPGLSASEFYKYEIKTQSGELRLKADPFAFSSEVAPGTASRIYTSTYQWDDQDFIAQRRLQNPKEQPLLIYEVHLGSWARVPEEGGRFLTYREIAPRLIAHMTQFGFTHLQLLPIAEHPFTGSWGYQITSYFAPTGRYGTPDDFRYLVDQCHQHRIGVLLDWVPAHFPMDDFALGRFDGTHLYEHEDPRLGEHKDWGTYIFNYGRNEVRNFLVSNALYWFSEFHIDGLRVDAVASMLYRDYSRQEGQWVANPYGGRENLEAVEMIKAMNQAIRDEHPGCMMVAEESTAWGGVTQPVEYGGLGFTFKWNMGWMHDSLCYFTKDPIHRRYHQNDLTFAMLYEYTESFIMPLSHDEVVHGKRSLLDKMPGDLWQKFANLRLLLTYQYTRPGKKLLFMGTEIAPYSEWNSEASLDWHLADDYERQCFSAFVADLGRLYNNHSCLWRRDHEPCGYQWVDHQDHDNSVLSYLRWDDQAFLLIILNFTPVPRFDYRVGVPEAGRYLERFCSDDRKYWGSEFETLSHIESQPIPYHGFGQSIVCNLPPLGGVVLERQRTKDLPIDDNQESPHPIYVTANPSGRPYLSELAKQYGIVAEYEDMEHQTRHTSDTTREMLLGAMGLDASTEEQAEKLLTERAMANQKRSIDSVRVVRRDDPSARTLMLRIPTSIQGSMRWRVVLRCEEGTLFDTDGVIPNAHASSQIDLEDAARLEPGYYHLKCSLAAKGFERVEEQKLIIAPQTCVSHETVLSGRRAFGLWTHLYSVKSQNNWGFGDLSDLKTLMQWAIEIGAEFVGINPLHALNDQGVSQSPYFPQSRLYHDLLYLDLSVVPELSVCTESMELMASAEFRADLEKLKRARRINYKRVQALKVPVLKALYRTFLEHHAIRQTDRGRQYRRYVKERGETLTGYATFCALRDHLSGASRTYRDWRRWPATYQDVNSKAVIAFRDDNQYEVDFYRYVQFEIERQLSSIDEISSSNGMSIGLYNDLALGSPADSCDAWSFPRLMVRGASIGAPPDAFSRFGQDWSLAPIAPMALKEAGYNYWICLLQQALRHSGALRIDHVMGLSRQFWIPSGSNPTQGAYVEYPSEDLFGILALESQRNNALIIGEDLGTVPEGFSEIMNRWGLLSSRVFYFERDEGRGMRSPGEYSPQALVTANTHDLATLAGFWEGIDLEYRYKVGHIADLDALQAEQYQRDKMRKEILSLLVDQGIVQPGWQPSGSKEFCWAITALLSQTPCPLLGIALDDLGIEVEAVNLPGISNKQDRNWTRRMRMSLESLMPAPTVQFILRGVENRRTK